MKLTNTTEAQFRQAVRVAAKKGAAMQRKIIVTYDEGSRDFVEKAVGVEERVCPDCLAHYLPSSSYNHECDGLMKALVDFGKASKPKWKADIEKRYTPNDTL
jgi:hypothetical protein